MNRKLIILLAVLACVLCIWLLPVGRPQSGSSVSMQISSGAPTGSCAATQLAIDTTTGNLWTCGGGVWRLTATSAVLSGTTGSIGGGLLVVGASASGTATVTGATTGMVCIAQASDGTNMAALGASPMCTVTAPNTATVNLVAIVSLTPAAKTYNVRVFQ